VYDALTHCPSMACPVDRPNVPWVPLLPNAPLDPLHEASKTRAGARRVEREKVMVGAHRKLEKKPPWHEPSGKQVSPRRHVLPSHADQSFHWQLDAHVRCLWCWEMPRGPLQHWLQLVAAVGDSPGLMF
jgi:hypothetical protein